MKPHSATPPCCRHRSIKSKIQNASPVLWEEGSSEGFWGKKIPKPDQTKPNQSSFPSEAQPCSQHTGEQEMKGP